MGLWIFSSLRILCVTSHPTFLPNGGLFRRISARWSVAGTLDSVHSKTGVCSEIREPQQMSIAVQMFGLPT